jgi:hypothetical protein
MAFAQNASAKAFAAARGPGELRQGHVVGAQLRRIAYGCTEFRRRNHMSVI